MTIEIGALDKDLSFQLAGIDPSVCFWNGHAITQSDGPEIEKAIRSRIRALLLTEESPHLRAAVDFASEKVSDACPRLLQKEVVQFLDTPKGLVARTQYGTIVPVGMWKSTKKFCKKHTTAILFGVGVVAVVATIVVITVATGGTGAVAATAAAGALSSAMEKKPHDAQPPHSNTPHCIPSDQPQIAAPFVPAPGCGTSSINPFVPSQDRLDPTFLNHPFSPRTFPLNDYPFIPQAPLGFLPKPQVDLYPIPEQGFAEALPPMIFDPEYGPKIIGESSNIPTFGDHLRHIGSSITHEVFGGVAEIASLGPQLMDEIGAIGSKILPESILSDGNDCFPTGNRLSHFEDSVVTGHQFIDQIFGTNQAPAYSSDAVNPIDITYGWIPPPIPFPTRGLPIAQFRQIITAGQEAAVLAEELGFTTRQICQLEQAGALDTAVTAAVDKLYQNHAMQESVIRFRYAQEALKPYMGQYMSEAQAFERLREVGIPSFPRPAGIPDTFRVRLSEKPGGIKYVHPDHTHESIRIMPGKPHNPNPYQQKPYVVHMKDGSALDKYGNPLIDNSLPEAHIPFDEFIYRSK